ncbi:MAG TPA: transaldolase family protein [Terriglobales bacterium]
MIPFVALMQRHYHYVERLAIANAREVRLSALSQNLPGNSFRGIQTSTKDPAFSDVLYVEEFIGPHSINTILPATLHVFRDHRRVQRTLEAGEQDAERALARLAKLGIDLSTWGQSQRNCWPMASAPSPFFARTADLVAAATQSGCLRVMQPERAEFGLLALRDMRRD